MKIKTASWMMRFGFALLLAEQSHAYVITVSAQGTVVHWTVPKINVAGNPTNQVGISADYFRQATVRSLQRWTSASAGQVKFDYWQGTDSGTYSPNSNYDNLSSVYFASNLKNGTQTINANIIGMTQVWYDTTTAEILETDIELNDLNFNFTANPADTSGMGAGGGGGGTGSRVYLENVLTHELGHAYGLSHSGGLQSSMLYMEAPDQAHLSCDDISAIRALYGGNYAVGDGAIRGRIFSEAGSGIFGAHVVAISNDRGVAVAQAITGPTGDYTILGIEPGTYHLMVEPFYFGATVLPPYYNNMSSAVCSGSRFGRMFNSVDGHALDNIVVSPGQYSDGQNFEMHCGTGAGANVSDSRGSATLAAAPTVHTGAGAVRFGVVDRFTNSNDLYYRLSGFSGALDVRALSYSLYSPVRIKLEIVNGSGVVVSNQSSNPVYTSESGFSNYDSYTAASGLGAGDYYLHVSRLGNMGSNYYPAGGTAIDAVPFFVLTFHNNVGPSPNTEANPGNAKCRMPENFPEYKSPDGNPKKQRQSGGGLFGCGTVSDVNSGQSGGPSGGTGGIDFMTLGSFLLPFAWMTMAWWILRHSRRRIGDRRPQFQFDLGPTHR